MKRLSTRLTAATLMLVLGGAAEPLLGQQSSAPQQAPSSQTTLPPLELPENPGKTAAQKDQTSAPQPTPQPSGTAVAPPVELSGGAASKPAGVALAPPKQRQMRSLLIKFGFIAAAGAALGTVVALSAASPGRVPNSGR